MINNNRGYTYLITNGREYKIGITTKTPQSRVAELQTGSPTKITISGYSYNSNALAMEVELHKKFSSKRLEGEWFALNDDDIAIIHHHFENNYLDEFHAPLSERGIEANRKAEEIKRKADNAQRYENLRLEEERKKENKKRKEAREAKEAKEAREAKEAYARKQRVEYTARKEAREAREVREAREAKEAYEGKQRARDEKAKEAKFIAEEERLKKLDELGDYKYKASSAGVAIRNKSGVKILKTELEHAGFIFDRAYLKIKESMKLKKENKS